MANYGDFLATIKQSVYMIDKLWKENMPNKAARLALIQTNPELVKSIAQLTNHTAEMISDFHLKLWKNEFVPSVGMKFAEIIDKQVMADSKLRAQFVAVGWNQVDPPSVMARAMLKELNSRIFYVISHSSLQGYDIAGGIKSHYGKAQQGLEFVITGTAVAAIAVIGLLTVASVVAWGSYFPSDNKVQLEKQKALLQIAKETSDGIAQCMNNQLFTEEQKLQCVQEIKEIAADKQKALDSFSLLEIIGGVVALGAVGTASFFGVKWYRNLGKG